MNILLLPTTTTAASLVERLAAWSRTGLVRPFCMWRANAANMIEVQCVQGGELHELSLPAALDRASSGEPRFVAFYPVADEHEQIDDDFPELVEKFLASVAGVLDFQADGPPTCTLAIAPATAEQPIPASLFRANWENLIVAPEDRARPGSTNGLVGNDPGLAAHAAHAAATIAMLWSTPHGNSPDLIERIRSDRAGALPVAVRVVRCFSRSVELGYVADHVASAALTSRDGWPRPNDSFDRARDPEAIAARLVRGYLEKHENTLLVRPFEEVREDPPPALTLIEALRLLADRMAALLQRRPFELAEDAIAALHDKAAAYVERLAGPRSGIHVRRWDELPAAERGLPQLRRRLDKPMVVDDGAVSATWKDLRLLALGLMDGSPLPEAIGAEALRRGTRRVVICNPGQLARDPDFEYGDEADDSLLGQIRVRVAAAALAARARAEMFEQAAAEADEDEDGDRDEQSPDRVATQPVRRRRTRAQESVRALLRHVAFMGLGAVAALVAVWAKLTLLPGLGASVAIMLAWLLASANAARRRLVRPRVVDDPQAAADLLELNRVLQLRQAQADAVRLERRLGELGDWIEMLAELLHRPWVREPLGALQVGPTVDERQMPKAFAAAVALPSPRLLERIGGRARAQAFRPGWLSSIYLAVEATAMREWASSNRQEDDLPDPAEDVSDDPESPRRALLEVLVKGEGRRLAENPITIELLSAVDEALLDELAPTVSEANGSFEPLGPTTVWLAAPPQTGSIGSQHAGRLVAVDHGVAVIVAPGVALSSHVAVAGGRKVHASNLAGEELTVHDVHHLSPRGLVALLLDTDQVAEIERHPEPRSGIGIAALDCSADGGVVTRWGILTHIANELGVVFDGPSPSPGAPLFDLDGLLVGIYEQTGRAHVVEDVAHLVAQAKNGPSVEGSNNAGPQLHDSEPPTRSASEFLDAIINANGGRALLACYWVTSDDANRIALSLPTSLALSPSRARVDQLSGKVRFMHPLRIMAHRIEATRGVAPEDLAWCRAAGTRPGPVSIGAMPLDVR